MSLAIGRGGPVRQTPGLFRAHPAVCRCLSYVRPIVCGEGDVNAAQRRTVTIADRHRDVEGRTLRLGAFVLDFKGVALAEDVMNNGVVLSIWQNAINVDSRRYSLDVNMASPSS